VHGGKTTYGQRYCFCGTKSGGRHRFAKGNTYGKKGRPVGSKVKLSESFLAGIAADFAKYGKDVIQ
jgi:hypothetical protein